MPQMGPQMGDGRWVMGGGNRAMGARQWALVALAPVVLAIVIGLVVGAPSAQTTTVTSPRAPLPASLSDQDFWKFVTDHSEQSGVFPRENLTSNEVWFERVIPDLLKRAKTGGVYLGVGPEQNFTYIAALKPAMAIIFDIRRGNLDVQLMYKAIFELTKDRADFMAMLFSRPRPAGLGPQSTVLDLFTAFANVHSSSTLYDQNLKAIDDQLIKTHKLGMSKDDVEWVQYVFQTFYRYGYAIRPSPSYADLMTATDQASVYRSYLANDANFLVLKDLETKNLVIPLVGDFGGRKAIREVGTYLKAHSATVSAYYLSNVEDYLYQDNKWPAFCRNVATLPLDTSSTFIRTTSRGRGPAGGFGGFGGGGFVSSLGAIASEVRSCP
jgi:hypothetical protein